MVSTNKSRILTQYGQIGNICKLEVLSICHCGEIKLPYLLASRTNIFIKGNRNLEGYGRQVQWSFQIIKNHSDGTRV